MLEEKTKKGGWKAKHIDTKLTGSMVDATNAPQDASVGQEVDLIVHYATDTTIMFKWKKPLSQKKGRPKRR